MQIPDIFNNPMVQQLLGGAGQAAADSIGVLAVIQGLVLSPQVVYRSK